MTKTEAGKLAAAKLGSRPLVRTSPQARPKAAAKMPAKAALRTDFSLGDFTDFSKLYCAEPMERVQMIKCGAPAQMVEVLARRMHVPKEKLFSTLGLARATVNRKVIENKPLSSDETARVLGLARLVGQVETLIQESGDGQGFDAAQWLAQWLDQPLPALGGQRPNSLMDTQDGQAIVSSLLARMQSGAYS